MLLCNLFPCSEGRGGGTNSRVVIVNKVFVASNLSCTEHITCQKGTNPEQMNNIVKVFYLCKRTQNNDKLLGSNNNWSNEKNVAFDKN